MAQNFCPENQITGPAGSVCGYTKGRLFMMGNFWAAIMASKGAKVGGGLVAGGSTLALVFNMFSSRLDDIDQKIEHKEKEIRQYVDLKHDAVLLQLKFMNDRQQEMNELLKTISDRMYNERQNRGGR